MTDTFRALCSELVDIATAHCNPDDFAVGYCAAVCARAALAQTEPEGPTDEELLAAQDQAVASFPPIHPDAETLSAVEYARELEIRKARAVLARWARPAIKPVPVAERLPGPEDCFPNNCGQRSRKCWAQQYYTDSNGEPLRTIAETWDLVDYRLLAECRRWYYAWLPYHFLPVPTPTTTDTP